MSWILWIALTLAQPAPPTSPDAGLAEVLEHRDELMEMLAQHDPRKHAHMERLERTDPQAFALGLLRLAKTVQRLQADPDAAERWKAMKEETDKLETLARGYSELSNADQKRRRGEMEAAARRLMEHKQAERRSRVEELRAKIAELESDIEQREKDADKLVDAFIDQLLSTPVDL